MAVGAAKLDAARGEIIGFAMADAARPARVKVFLNGVMAVESVAVASILSLGEVGAGAFAAPTSPICAFALRLPMTCAEMLATGGVLTVTVSESSADAGAVLLETPYEGFKALACFVEGYEMADSLTLEISRLRAGEFTGRLHVHHDGAAPDIRLCIRGRDIGGATLTATGAGRYDVTAMLPSAALDDGVSMVEFALPNGEVLTRYPLSAGAALAGDLAAEVASLRAEMDQLKSAFRGAMAGGVITRDERPMIIAEALTQVDNILEMRDRSDRFERVEFDDPADDGDDFEWNIET